MRLARIKSNRTLTEVASAAGITKGALSRIETGTGAASKQLAEVLSRILGNITEMEILYPERYVKAALRQKNGRAA